jgi:hypothetical protein
MPPLTNLPFQNSNLHSLTKATVLQLVPGDEITPSSRAAIEVAAALSVAGARALVACTARLKSELQAKGGIFLPLPSSSKNPLLMALSTRRLARVIEMEGADIVHVRSRALGWTAYGATRLTKTPLVTSYGCGYDSRNPILARYNSVLARGDIVLAESIFAAALAAKHFPPAADKIRVIRRGINCQAFAQDAVAPQRVETVRQQWQAAPHEQVVLVLVPSSGSGSTGTLTEAVGLLCRSGLSGVKFVLVCGKNAAGSRGLSADRAIARAGLQGTMRPAPPHCDMPAALLAATLVAVLPAAGAPDIGEAVIQAQAMGTPVIAANVGAAPEIVLAPPAVTESARTGYLVAPGDAPALAVAMANALMLGPSARSRLSARAIAHAEKHHSAGRVCADILEVYASLRRARKR